MTDPIRRWKTRLASGDEVFVPDVMLDASWVSAGSPDGKLDRTFALHPTHGSPFFAVEDLDGAFLGFLEPELVGFPSVADWMVAKQYIIRCSCPACARVKERLGLP